MTVGLSEVNGILQIYVDYILPLKYISSTILFAQWDSFYCTSFTFSFCVFT